MFKQIFVSRKPRARGRDYMKIIEKNWLGGSHAEAKDY